MLLETMDVLEWIRSHYFGKYRGEVLDNQDAASRGRLKVRVKGLGGLEAWADPCVPYAGKGVGFYSLPDVGSGVWVEFAAGDLSYPIWTGCFWADGELPDPSGPAVKIWKTESLTVRLDDDAGEMVLKNATASSITLALDVTTESGLATHTVGIAGVASEHGVGKLEVTVAGVKVNNGSMVLL